MQPPCMGWFQQRSNVSFGSMRTSCECKVNLTSQMICIKVAVYLILVHLHGTNWCCVPKSALYFMSWQEGRWTLHSNAKWFPCHQVFAESHYKIGCTWNMLAFLEMLAAEFRYSCLSMGLYTANALLRIAIDNAKYMYSYPLVTHCRASCSKVCWVGFLCILAYLLGMRAFFHFAVLAISLKMFVKLKIWLPFVVYICYWVICLNFTCWEILTDAEYEPG